MSNIQKTFENKLAKGQKAFIPFITVADPHIEATEKFIYALEEAGSTIIELGIPFSDPVADGPVIQRASLRAEKAGFKLEQAFELVKRVRQKTDIPLVFLMYANMIHHYDINKFFERCKEVGVDGVIAPDVPMEERDEFRIPAKMNGVDFISLVAPTSKDRVKDICEDSSGFLYCVSSLGVTGTRESIKTNFGDFFEDIKRHCDIPTAIGFGISNKEQVKLLKQYCEGIIIGSAVVKIIEEKGEGAAVYIKEFASEMVEELNK